VRLLWPGKKLYNLVWACCCGGGGGVARGTGRSQVIAPLSKRRLAWPIAISCESLLLRLKITAALLFHRWMKLVVSMEWIARNSTIKKNADATANNSALVELFPAGLLSNGPTHDAISLFGSFIALRRKSVQPNDANPSFREVSVPIKHGRPSLRWRLSQVWLAKISVF